MAFTKRSGIQLCYPYESARLKKWNTDVYLVQPKLDGDRCRAIIDEMGMPTLISSTGHIIKSVPHIEEQLYDLKLRNIELDGELYVHGASHQDINSVVSRTTNIHSEFESIEYHIFDCVTTSSTLRRIMNLIELYIPVNSNIRIVPTFSVSSEEEIMAKLEEFMANNYEGIIVRHPDALYERKRSTNIMKFKPRREDFYTIVGFEEEISIHGEPKNSLGALVLSSNSLDDNGKEETFKVGSGSYLTRERRKELWANRLTLVGAIAHIKYQHLTDRKIPRFPVLANIIKAR
jgi:DNA ligase 1